ncbi:hypothetical protein SJAG_00042 [Schizosaccharomyces japonicus yFS275]|uniref:Kinesin motor domain-containing protein n=1 Tax=Schizosaccharomyces japonicus (strain yFS275 / FY16936) TaxID=402676 RepID=B6JUU9_SCHJY|nr:hypothetical protein SJAG_00042 [Schizosaccharomyces japonicus yFS275]EEB05050.1 hypothetical protein SJAG_00042 [Schizosaccharomyces japonicus yFS275]
MAIEKLKNANTSPPWSSVISIARIRPLSLEEMIQERPCVLSVSRENKKTNDIYSCMITRPESEYTITVLSEPHPLRFTVNHCSDSRGLDCSSYDIGNETLHARLMKPLLHKQNVCLFVCGSTGSGKSFSLYGTNRSPGCVSLVLKQYFEADDFLGRRSISIHTHQFLLQKQLGRLPDDDCFDGNLVHTNTYEISTWNDFIPLIPSLKQREIYYPKKDDCTWIRQSTFLFQRTNKITTKLVVIELQEDVLKQKMYNNQCPLGDLNTYSSRLAQAVASKRPVCLKMTSNMGTHIYTNDYNEMQHLLILSCLSPTSSYDSAQVLNTTHLCEEMARSTMNQKNLLNTFTTQETDTTNQFFKPGKPSMAYSVETAIRNEIQKLNQCRLTKT